MNLPLFAMNPGTALFRNGSDGGGNWTDFIFLFKSMQ